MYPMFGMSMVICEPFIPLPLGNPGLHLPIDALQTAAYLSVEDEIDMNFV